MRKIDRLRKEALQSCNFRGHKMGRFHAFYSNKHPLGSWSECKVCSATVSITIQPLANQINIGGPAVAINCIGDKP